MGHGVVDQTQLHDVLGQGVGLGIHLTRFRVAAKKMERKGSTEGEAEGGHHRDLHLADLLRCVGVVGDVDKVT